MEAVINLARAHERLLIAARAVIADWTASNNRALEPGHDESSYVVGWRSLAKLECLVKEDE